MSYSDQRDPIVANSTGAFLLSSAELSGGMFVTIICDDAVLTVTTLESLQAFILTGGGLGIGAAGLIATGTTQATAAPIENVINVFATVPFNSGAILPEGYSSVIPVQIINNGANLEKIYPFFGDQIAGYGVNQPVLVESGGGVLSLTCFDSITQSQPRTWWTGGGVASAGGLLNDGGVLLVTTPGIFPTSNVGLLPGDLYSNGGVVSVVPGAVPNPLAPPVIYGFVSAAALFTIPGADFPIVRPAAGSLIIWNAGGELWVA